MKKNSVGVKQLSITHWSVYGSTTEKKDEFVNVAQHSQNCFLFNLFNTSSLNQLHFVAHTF
jgi:hypothetical protein